MLLQTTLAYDFTEVDAVLRDAVASHAFPGAVALIADKAGVVHSTAVGAYTYAVDAPKMDAGPFTPTLFDLASLTKVTATTTAAMLLYQDGRLPLDAKLTEYFGEAFAATDARKADATVRNLLLHNAGWPPDPTPVSFCAPACSEVKVQPPQARNLSFSCQPKVVAALLTQKLDQAPGAKFVHSDISMISMMFVLGNVARTQKLVAPAQLLASCVAQSGAAAGADAQPPPPTGLNVAPIDQCYYEALVRASVLSKLTPAGFIGFRPPLPLWKRCARVRS